MLETRESITLVLRYSLLLSNGLSTLMASLLLSLQKGKLITSKNPFSIKNDLIFLSTVSNLLSLIFGRLILLGMILL